MESNQNTIEELENEERRKFEWVLFIMFALCGLIFVLLIK